jgi:general secretion pathway protein I
MKLGRGSSRAGFTLVEVLVALTVVAIAMGALWSGLSQGLAVNQGLPDRIMARWVAQNRLVLHQALGEWPETRSYTGTEEMGGRVWYWQELVSETPEENMRRITVSVGTSPDDILIRLEGYLHQARSGFPYERMF